MEIPTNWGAAGPQSSGPSAALGFPRTGAGAAYYARAPPRGPIVGELMGYFPPSRTTTNREGIWGLQLVDRVEQRRYIVRASSADVPAPTWALSPVLGDHIFVVASGFFVTQHETRPSVAGPTAMAPPESAASASVVEVSSTRGSRVVGYVVGDAYLIDDPLTAAASGAAATGAAAAGRSLHRPVLELGRGALVEAQDEALRALVLARADAAVLAYAAPPRGVGPSLALWGAAAECEGEEQGAQSFPSPLPTLPATEPGLRECVRLLRARAGKAQPMASAASPASGLAALLALLGDCGGAERGSSSHSGIPRGGRLCRFLSLRLGGSAAEGPATRLLRDAAEVRALPLSALAWAVSEAKAETEAGGAAGGAGGAGRSSSGRWQWAPIAGTVELLDHDGSVWPPAPSPHAPPRSSVAVELPSGAVARLLAGLSPSESAEALLRRTRGAGTVPPALRALRAVLVALLPDAGRGEAGSPVSLTFAEGGGPAEAPQASGMADEADPPQVPRDVHAQARLVAVDAWPVGGMLAAVPP